MKRSLWFALAAALLASCSTKEIDIQTPAGDNIEFYATFEQPAEDGTRVYVNEDLLLRWTADDRVSIFNKNTYNQQYRFLGETGDNSGGFSKVEGADFVAGSPISHVVSVYPYHSGTKVSEDETITLTLPAEQHYAEKTFGLGANTMVAVSEDNLLQYNHVCGFLRLRLFGDGVSVSSVSLIGNNGEKLAGQATVTMPLDGVPSLVMSSEATEVITLTCDAPVVLGATAEESTDFWFVVPTHTFSRGFTVCVTQSTGGISEKSTTKSITIERGRVSSMAPFEVEPISGSVFTYTTTDGKAIALRYPDFGGAAIVSNEYEDGVGRIVFDKIVSTIGDQAFSFCQTLTSIVIPDSVTSIGRGAFYFCANLPGITIPESVTSIGDSAFALCSGLTSLVIPSGVTSIGEGITSSCVKLESIVVNPANPAYNSRENCNAIIETSSDLVVAGCQYSVLPDGVTGIGANAFSGCINLWHMTLPESVTSIGKNAFLFCEQLKNIIMPAGITAIGESAFYGCTGLAFISSLSATPPAGSQDMFSETGNCPIYVHLSSLSSYKAADYWKDYADRIQPFTPAFPEPKIVDMGLSVKWASFNLGASNPGESGDYYGWGETETYYSSLDPLTWKEGKEEGYFWSSYSYSMNFGTSFPLTKYCTPSTFGTYGYEGYLDGKTILEPEDDIVQLALGDKWRMPTVEEFQELYDNCSVSSNSSYYTSSGTVRGYLFTSNITGNSIFLPKAGYFSGIRLSGAGSGGNYWTSSLKDNIPNLAWSAIIESGDPYKYYCSRSDGYPIRPVYGDPPIPVESFSLDRTSIELLVGGEETIHPVFLPENATYQTVTWSTVNSSIATVSSSGVVTGVAPGKVSIMAETSGGKMAICTVTVKAPVVPVPEAVDLGLSVKWASFNLGASAPEEFGYYYAWGEIEPKNGEYSWATYRWCEGSESTLTKYNSNPSCGPVDNNDELDPEDDAAHVLLCGSWRMPTLADIRELIVNTTSEWTEVNGVYGRRITSTVEGYTDKSIFLPAAGYAEGSGITYIGRWGTYASSSLHNGPYYANFLIGPDRYEENIMHRFRGLPIRPVCAK